VSRPRVPVGELGLRCGSRLCVLQREVRAWCSSRLPAESARRRGSCILVRPSGNAGNEMPSLDQLRRTGGRIESLAGDDALVQRLLEMGLFEGGRGSRRRRAAGRPWSAACRD